MACTAILKGGPRKGEECGKESCGRHVPDNVSLVKRDGSQASFLEAMGKVGNITRAAELAGVNRKSHYEWMKDPAYEERFRDALATATDVLREAAWTRAVDGIESPVFNKEGEHVGDKVVYSDTLLIFLMKAASPAEFRDNYHLQVSGTVEHRVSLDWEQTESSILDAAEKRRAIDVESTET